MIRVEGLKKNFKKAKVEAVKEVSFSVDNHEIFALLGPNGAGKTTTLRMLSTLLQPTSGVILYDNKEIQGNELEIRRKISFVTSEVRLDGQFTPNRLARYFGVLYGMTDEEIAANTKELFEYFGISEYADRKYGSFSTGMKQKTSIAISLIHDPEILILDEPTNGLDILTQELVEQYILRERERGKCIILSTHILEIVERLADRVGVIIDGKLVFCGTKEEMTTVSKSKDLHEAFVRFYEENHEAAAEEASH